MRRLGDEEHAASALRPFSAANEGLASAESPAMIEAAILFTDLRRSTALASALAPPALFDAINRSLSAQAGCVRRWGGTVVKFTGDGLLANFRGRGRAHLALRCALELQQDSAAREPDLPIGVGVAEGVVMKGLIGEPGNQLFDVIGATVHLAARLCASAQDGETVITPRLMRAAGLPLERARTRMVELRGFDQPFDAICIPAHGGGNR